MSLRFRINALISVMIALFTVMVGDIVVDDVRRGIREEMEAGTKVTLQLLTTVIYSSQFMPEPGGAVLQRFLRRLGRIRAHELRLYDDGGHLLYHSPPSLYKSGREAPAWFEKLVRPDLRDVEIVLPGGRIVLSPDASRSVLDAWDDLSSLLWLVFGLFVLLNMLVFVLLGHALRPVRVILRGLSEMQAGRYETRLPTFPLPEFDAISATFNRMAGALEASHAENRRLALVAKQSSDAIIIHDLDGNVSFWNPAAERLFGYSPEQILGRSATLLTPPGLEQEVADNLAAIKQQRVVENLETRRLAMGGRAVDVALAAAPLIDPGSGEVIGEICCMRDITEHRRAQQAQQDLEQNRRLTQLIQIHLEEERRAIARELHDELGQCVTAIKTIGTAIANRTPEGEEVHRSARTIVEVASHIYDVVHGIIRQLRPSALDHLGLDDALEESVGAFRGRHPEIEVELVLEGDLKSLGEAVNITAYRIVQECLTNVARHAQATQAHVHVRRDADVLGLQVSDNGRGLGERDLNEAARFGLLGMRERVQAVAGDFELSSPPGAGLTVRARIPLQAAPAGAAQGG